jgi:membrane protein YdbS with pleckstrin-like domain
MDESALQARLDRIERRQYLILALLVVPYLYWFGTVVGFWVAGAVYIAVALVAVVAVFVSRRRRRNAAGQ